MHFYLCPQLKNVWFRDLLDNKKAAYGDCDNPDFHAYYLIQKSLCLFYYYHHCW